MKTATTVTVILAAMVLGAILCVFILGTMFFDDPHASYGGFVAGLVSLALVVVATTAACLALGWLLSRSGRPRSALVVVLLPMPLVLAYGIYLGS